MRQRPPVIYQDIGYRTCPLPVKIVQEKKVFLIIYVRIILAWSAFTGAMECWFLFLRSLRVSFICIQTVPRNERIAFV